jgi:elongation factor 3
MAPAATSSSSAGAQKAENSKSIKAVEELLSKLSISKAQDEISQVSLDLANLVNGDIEDADAPTQ